MSCRFNLFLSVAAVLSLALPAVAQVSPAPALINFQGKLANVAGQPVPDGSNYTVTVSLWDAATGGTQKWSQTLNNVTVKSGLFSALLTADTAGLFNGANLWMQVAVAGDPAMTPRQQIASVPFALKSNTVPDGSIGSSQLALDGTSLGKVAGGKLLLNGAFVGVGTGLATERLTINGRLAFQQIGGDQGDAGKLDYRGFDPDSFSVVGAGTAAGNRNVRLWDTVSVGYSEPFSGVAVFNGSVGIGTVSPQAPLNVSTTAGFPAAALVSSSNTGGTWLQLANTSPNGRGWSLVSTGSGNGEGAGNLLWYDHGAGASRMVLTNTGRVGIGTATPSTALEVNGEVTAQVVTVLGGSDVAEPYHVADTAGVKPIPGMVVAMDSEHVGQMKIASHAYDPAVGGILSGANGVQPGLTLRQKGTVADGDLPVASVGRVWCYADADANGPITTGALLTTSDTPGYAMRVTDFNRANGCVIGKAMSGLASGKSLVLVLVSLK